MENIQKRFIATCLIALFCLIPQSVAAESWGGLQTQLSLGSEVELSEDVGWRAWASWFSSDGQEADLFFGYTGPTFTLGPVWVSPQVGGISGWASQDLPITSIWLATAFLDGQLNLFAEQDIYTNGDDVLDTYGYYSCTWTLGQVSVGGQAELVNSHVTVGPQVGFSAGPVGFSLSHFYAPEIGVHTVRFLFRVTGSE